MEPYRAYTGVGSRETPEDVLVLMRDAAQALAEKDWTLRTGRAPGADRAFERGAFLAGARPDRVEVYLPWPKFEEGEGWYAPTRDHPSKEALEAGPTFVPHWDHLKRGARQLHARNVHQVLGEDVTSPVWSSFVLYWAREDSDGNPLGGTATAVRIAAFYGIPAFNLLHGEARLRVERMVTT